MEEIGKMFRNFLAEQVQLIGPSRYLGGRRLTSSNRLVTTEFKKAWLNLASDLTLQSDVGVISAMGRIKNFNTMLSQYDLLDILAFCQDASDYLIRNPKETYNSFKDYCAALYPLMAHDIGRLLSPIQPCIVSYLLGQDAAVNLRRSLMFLRYGKKLVIENPVLEEQAITAYLETESRLSAIVIDRESDLIKGLNSILVRWLSELDLHDLVPRHGSGSVAEGKMTLKEKYDNLGIDIYLKVVLGSFYRDYYPPTVKENGIVRVSRTVFVPKTFSKLRTISMEPVSLQYWQQAIMTKLYKYIKYHPFLGKVIKLEDQEQNRTAARQGSITNLVSTIDLSAASDSVSWDLVKAIFAKTPLLKWMYATRSSKTVLPNGQIIALKKYAPMGSALCFPVECLIFAAVIEYCVRKMRRECSCFSKHYTVYGDDLIVATEVTDSVIEALNSIGFLVNKSKSYTEGPFRESCGGDYFEGVDVSSVYYRLKAFKVGDISPEVFASMCSAVNTAHTADLPLLRSYLLKLFKDMKPYFTNSVDKNPMIYSPTPTNFHVKAKWNEDYQCWLGKFVTVLSKPELPRLPEDDDISYFVRLAQMAVCSKQPRAFDEEPVEVTLRGTRVLLGYVTKEVDR